MTDPTSPRNLLSLAGVGAVVAAFVLILGVTKTATDTGLPSAEAAPAAPSTSSEFPAEAPGGAVVESTQAPSPAATATAGGPAASDTATLPIDDRGFVNSSARCDQTAVAIARTQRSRVVICSGQGGSLEYRGVRLSDGARLTAPAERTSAGTFVARSNGITYTVSSTELVASDGSEVILRQSMLEFIEPGAASSTPSPSTAAATTAETSRPIP